MGNQHLLALLWSKKGALILWGLLFAVLGYFILMFVEQPYQTKTDFLVVQGNAQNQDFYTQFKSSEYLGNILAEAIYSDRFLDALIGTGKVNREFLPFDRSARLATWKRMIIVDKNLQLGILSVTVKGTSERDIARIMEGVTQVLVEQNTLFRGGDEKSVEIRILSGPILERSPTMDKVAKTTLASFFAGIFIAAFMVIVKNETRYRAYERGGDAVPLNDRMA